MKKSLLFILLLLGTASLYAQTPTTASATAGWKRIASISSLAGRGFGKVTVFTTGGSYVPYQTDIHWFKDWGNAGGISVYSNSKSAYWTQVRLTVKNDTAYIEVNFSRDVTDVKIMSDTYGWNKATSYSGVLPDGGGGTVLASAKTSRLNIEDKLMVAFNGNVGINTASPGEQLSVNGNIRAKEIKVETANWPDYVLKKGYPLMSLDSLQKEINTLGRLPGMPAAHEVEKNGLALGEWNRLLTEKNEELTLYILELYREIKALKETQRRVEQRLQPKDKRHKY
ncbi:hypothetical protein A8C56_02735 [Niabella ginsenosidivorans]|uniref:Peptidase S74 domain-containing protein n=1 Tax=Niabella ginsenosidivorans TaxID=1176587 RepID=A0A1A9HZ17_9BACT|nr:cell division protein ZapB [Niabella ginsenosidivorans]ANH80039.1 hypothetical protein A8C56_02735 [Niabella ginsenosidivorans]